MSIPPIFSYSFTISQTAIDENNHVNNVAYVQWMQDAVVHFVESTGLKAQRGTGWVVRQHRIEYLLPAFFGEELEVRTWVTEIKRVRLHRRYEFIRKKDGKLLVKGETDWVFIDLKTGRPLEISEEVIKAVPILPDKTK